MAGHWSLVLNRELEDPEKIVFSSSKAAVLRDTHPKSKHHYLVVPKNVNIKNVFELSADHLPLLDDMLQLAKRLIDSLNMQQKDFVMGFKLEPSMQLLNLHVISTDFQSRHMKNERHWTNFHTRIFLPYDAAFEQIKNNGSIKRLTEDEMKQARLPPFKCNKCGFSTNMFHSLKRHLSTHWQMSAIVRNDKSTVGQSKKNPTLDLAESTSNSNADQQSSGLVAVNKMLEGLSLKTKETTDKVTTEK